MFGSSLEEYTDVNISFQLGNFLCEKTQWIESKTKHILSWSRIDTMESCQNSNMRFTHWSTRITCVYYPEMRGKFRRVDFYRSLSMVLSYHGLQRVRLTYEVHMPIRTILLRQHCICRASWSTVKAEAENFRYSIPDIILAAVSKEAA